MSSNNTSISAHKEHSSELHESLAVISIGRVCHIVAFPFILKHLKAKEEFMETQILHHAKKQLSSVG
jgi:hypothetical protein